jgi:hypothetical protein
MIPSFDTSGLLPPSPGDQPYPATMDELDRRFVLDLGSLAWRVELRDGFQVVRAAVADFVPSARWWLWGCFISSHAEPAMGNHQVMSALVILPESEVRTLGARLPVLVTFLQVAETQHRVDAAMVYEFEPGDERNIDTMDAMEGKWRLRARVGVADHGTGELVPAGFVEVSA